MKQRTNTYLFSRSYENRSMTDTNNGLRFRMITNSLALSQNVPGESAEAVNSIQMDNMQKMVVA